MTSPPPVGAYAVDTSTGRVGRILDTTGPHVRLAPVGCGREWACAPDDLRIATPAERLSAATAYANARSRGEVP
ncbi:hypothetical protein QMZ92_06920 [Streptomyces sp. HNM0645]|uniref:hypothetical protein n=1 Tax=Streptomyces sp. HNM0645 TaxID=2782343 RepID=UPI0024B756C6|nr:hypothetical protein [Streptomyces sp. HNM0645]MDI9884134.1 hypothetical protein [Streptomyces sp. HNM0645]